MQKRNLTRGHEQLFARGDDLGFSSLVDLWQHCQNQKSRSQDRWQPPDSIRPNFEAGRLMVNAGSDGAFLLNDWSFAQLCGISHVSKETVNRLSVETATKVFEETMPKGKKPLQLFTEENLVRSLHGVSYTRMFNADVVTMLREFAVDFGPPQVARSGHTGLYCGEQDMFCFLVDPTCWVEIEGEAFAPGFFVWNSEVGKRSVGVETFWFQKVCGNHIVWDAIEVTEFTRKHTANVHDALGDIRRIVEGLVQKRDERRDGFAKAIHSAMQTKLGADAEEAITQLGKSGFTKSLAKEAVEIARQKGALTVFAVVDALTRIAGRMPNAGDRTAADSKAASLLTAVT